MCAALAAAELRFAARGRGTRPAGRALRRSAQAQPSTRKERDLEHDFHKTAMKRPHSAACNARNEQGKELSARTGISVWPSGDGPVGRDDCHTNTREGQHRLNRPGGREIFEHDFHKTAMKLPHSAACNARKNEGNKLSARTGISVWSSGDGPVGRDDCHTSTRRARLS